MMRRKENDEKKNGTRKNEKRQRNKKLTPHRPYLNKPQQNDRRNFLKVVLKERKKERERKEVDFSGKTKILIIIFLKKRNQKKSGRTQSSHITASPDGVVTWRLEMRADLFSSMSLISFPFDQQTLGKSTARKEEQMKAGRWRKRRRRRIKKRKYFR